MTAKKESKVKSPEVEVQEVVVSDEAKKGLVPIGQAPKERFTLHVRGPKWIKDRDHSEAKMKELNARIIKVYHPRQKSADYVYVDFASAEDRDKAYDELLPLKDVYVQHSRKDDPKLVEARKAKVLAKREAKRQLKELMRNVAKKEIREGKSAVPKKFSNQIVIVNLPKETTQVELKEHFGSIVDVKLNVDKNKKSTVSRAILTLATPVEAHSATKKKVELHGIKLKIQMHQNMNEVWKLKRIQKVKEKKLAKKQAKKQKSPEGSSEAQPDVPLVLALNKPKTAKKKAKTAKGAKKLKAASTEESFEAQPAVPLVLAPNKLKIAEKTTKTAQGAKKRKATSTTADGGTAAAKTEKPAKKAKTAQQVKKPLAAKAKKPSPAKKAAKTKE